MAHPSFSPSGQVRFDVGRGQISMDGKAMRLMVPVDAVLALLEESDAEAVKDFGRRVGTELGRRAAARLSGAMNDATLEDVVDHLGGDMALAGLGSLGAERWGKALVFFVAGSPLGARGDPVIAAVLEGAVQRAMGRDVAVLPIQRDDDRVRLLVVSAATAKKVQGWLSGRVSWGEALARLNGAG